MLSGGSLPAFLNATLITLIPKVESPISFSQLSAFCNVMYKIITKVIANRLKKIIPDIISPMQTSFVWSCHIIENIIMTQEEIHSIGKKKGRKGFITIKIDL